MHNKLPIIHSGVILQSDTLLLSQSIFLWKEIIKQNSYCGNASMQDKIKINKSASIMERG